MLKQPSIVQQGQTVTLKTVGQGFQVSTEAKALNNAAVGQSIQVKVSSGEVITGIARSGGQVEVAF
jgi:flagella basal body P-ring formation protein FlgA